MAAGSLAFVIIGFWMIQDAKYYYAGLGGLLFFGLCLLVFLIQMCMPSLLLTINDEGIHNHIPFRHQRDVRWEEMAFIRPIRLPRGSVIGTVYVSPSGKQSYFTRNGKAKKISATRSPDDGPILAISFSCRTATLSYKQVVSQIQEQYSDLLARYQIVIYEA